MNRTSTREDNIAGIYYFGLFPKALNYVTLWSGQRLDEP